MKRIKIGIALITLFSLMFSTVGVANAKTAIPSNHAKVSHSIKAKQSAKTTTLKTAKAQTKHTAKKTSIKSTKAKHTAKKDNLKHTLNSPS